MCHALLVWMERTNFKDEDDKALERTLNILHEKCYAVSIPRLVWVTEKNFKKMTSSKKRCIYHITDHCGGMKIDPADFMDLLMPCKVCCKKNQVVKDVDTIISSLRRLQIHPDTAGEHNVFIAEKDFDDFLKRKPVTVHRQSHCQLCNPAGSKGGAHQVSNKTVLHNCRNCLLCAHNRGHQAQTK